jgi:hypothetical protein
MGTDTPQLPSILFIDIDRMAIDAVRDELSDEYLIHQAASVDEACLGIRSHPEICAVVLTVNDRCNNHASMMRLRECAKDLPILLVLGFPRGPFDYVPPTGFAPFGLVHKGDSPHNLTLLLREATKALRVRNLL